MKRLLWPLFWIALVSLAVYAFADAVDQTNKRTEKARQQCAHEGGEWFDYGRFETCRVKGDAR